MLSMRYRRGMGRGRKTSRGIVTLGAGWELGFEF